MLSTTGSCHHEEDMPAKAVAQSITYPVGHVLVEMSPFIRVVKSHEGWSHLSKHSWQPDTLFSSFNSDAPWLKDREEIDSPPLLLTVGIIVTDNMFLLNQRCYFCLWFSFSLCNSPLASCEFLFLRDVEALWWDLYCWPSVTLFSLLSPACVACPCICDCVRELSMCAFHISFSTVWFESHTQN